MTAVVQQKKDFRSIAGGTIFADRVDLLRGKRATDQQRRRCAIFLIRNNVDDRLIDDDTRRAIEAAEKFNEGLIDKQALSQARKGVAGKRLEGNGEEWDCQKHVIHAAWISTLTPFPSGRVDSLGQHVAHVMAVAECGKNPPSGWFPYGDPTLWAALGKLADQMVRFVDKEAKQAIENANRTEDHLADPRFQRDFFPVPLTREWLLTHVKQKKQQTIALKALDAFGRIQHREQITEQDLQPITQAALCSLKPVRETGVNMLLVVGSEFESARRELLKVLTSRNAEVRFTLVAQFEFYGSRHIPFPEQFVREVLERALRDNSPKVRMFGAQGCDSFDRKDLIPLLEDVLKNEKDSETFTSISQSLGMIRDGYVVDDSHAEPMIWVRTKRGSAGEPISQEDLQPDRLRQIAAKMREAEGSESGDLLSV